MATDRATNVCVACRADRVRHWRTVLAFDGRAISRTYVLSRCDACGTAVTEGRDEFEVALLHRGGVYAPPPGWVDRVLEPLRRCADRSTLAAIGDMPVGGQVVEFGSGDGRLLALIRAFGCAVRGIEPFAEPDGDVTVVRARLEDVRPDPESADLVLLWHVLEHVDDPNRALEFAARMLRPGGKIVVSVPRLDSLQARIGGNRWFHLDVPRHTVHFTRRGLTTLLERHGLHPVHISGLVLDQSLLGMTQTLLNLVTRERNVAFRALKGDRVGIPRRDLAASVLAVVPAVITAVLAEAVALASGRGGAIAVRAVRVPT